MAMPFAKDVAELWASLPIVAFRGKCGLRTRRLRGARGPSLDRRETYRNHRVRPAGGKPHRMLPDSKGHRATDERRGSAPWCLLILFPEKSPRFVPKTARICARKSPPEPKSAAYPCRLCRLSDSVHGAAFEEAQPTEKSTESAPKRPPVKVVCWRSGLSKTGLFPPSTTSALPVS